jgi:hypothetical protein
MPNEKNIATGIIRHNQNSRCLIRLSLELRENNSLALLGIEPSFKSSNNATGKNTGIATWQIKYR